MGMVPEMRVLANDVNHREWPSEPSSVGSEPESRELAWT